MADTNHGVRPVVCSECPFTTNRKGQALGESLRYERKAEIVADLGSGRSFVCHMEAHGTASKGPAVVARHCTGAAIVASRDGVWSTAMRLAAVLGEQWSTDEDRERVPYETLDQWVECSTESSR